MRLHCRNLRKRIWRTVSFFVAILILSGTIFGVSIAIPQNASATNDMAAEVVELINEIRAENGLSELTVYVELQQVADLRASEITEVFSHNRPDGTTCDTAYTLFGISTSACAENIAAGYSTAQSVVEGWMNSENHRANILNSKYTHIAVGLVYDASSEYKYYWVQEFSADYTVTATTAAATTAAPTTTAVSTTTAAPTAEETTAETVGASETTKAEETAEETEPSADEDTSSTNEKTGVVTGIKAKIIGDGYALEFSLPVSSEDEEQGDSSSETESVESIQEDESGTEDGQIDSEADSDESLVQAASGNEFAESELDAQVESGSGSEGKEKSGVSFFDILPWCIIAMLIVVIGILVIYIILMKRKKDEEDEDNEDENDNTRRKNQ